MAKKTSKKPRAAAAPKPTVDLTTAKPAAKAAPAPAAAAPAPVAAPAPHPTAATISARAHQIWIARGKPTPGTPLEDWLKAERDLGIRKS